MSTAFTIFVILQEMVKKAAYIIFLLLGLILFAPTSYAQEWKLTMEMVVTNDGKKMPGAFIEVRKNGSLQTTLRTDDRGNVDIVMDPDANYEITFTGSGMIKKKIAVDTRGVPAGEIKGQTYFTGEVDIFPKVDGLNLKILDEPIGKLKYDPEYGGFDADAEYTRRRKAAAECLSKQADNRVHRVCISTREPKL